MTLTLELPPNVEKRYLAEARARGVELDQLVLEMLISNSPGAQSPIQQGLGLFGSAEDSALLDEAVSIALDDRRTPSRRI